MGESEREREIVGGGRGSGRERGGMEAFKRDKVGNGRE